MSKKILKKIRVAVAVFFMSAITLLFLDYTGTVHAYLAWCAKVQLVAAILSVNAAVFVGLILMTLLLGRFYCSTICPLGVFQDLVSRFAGIKKKNRFSYRPPRKEFVALRFVLFGVFTLALIFHISIVVVLLEPYSAYGRMVSQIFGPVYLWGNNILAYFSERVGSYAFYSVDVQLKSMSALAVAVLTFAAVSIFAWKSGRGYCNTICPVGAFLGLLAKYSLIKPRIDKEKCGNCGLCAKNCKSACIDLNVKEIDYLRCVACFNCTSVCSKGAVNYNATILRKESQT